MCLQVSVSACELCSAELLVFAIAGSVKQAGTKDLERQRTSFFQSLRRTSTKTVDSDKPAAPSSPSTPPAHTAPPMTPPVDPPIHVSITHASITLSNGVSSLQQNQDSHTAEMTNGRDHDRRHSWDASDPRSKVSAEEEAFLRSLGWTEAGDDEDGELDRHFAYSPDFRPVVYPGMTNKTIRQAMSER